MKNFIEVQSSNSNEWLLINISAISIVVDKKDSSVIYTGEKGYAVQQCYKEVIDRIKISQGELNPSKDKGINVIQ